MMIALSLPGLLDREKAYTLDSGDTIVVTTTQYLTPNDPAWLTLQIDVEVIDPLTMATRYTLAPHAWKVQTAALQGSTTIEAETAAAHARTEQWALDYLGAQRALAQIDATPDPGVPVTRDRSL